MWLFCYIWFQPKQDSDRIRISFLKNRIGSDSKNPLSDHLWHILLLLPKLKSDSGSRSGISQIFDCETGSEQKTQITAGVDSGTPDLLPPLRWTWICLDLNPADFQLLDGFGFKYSALPLSSEISDFSPCTLAQSNILHIKYADKTYY